MSVDLNLKVQCRRNDKWDTVKIEAESINWCGGWFRSLLYGAPFLNRGIPEGVEFPEFDGYKVEECGYDFTWFTPEEFQSYLQEKLERFFVNYRDYINEDRISRVESKIDCLLANKPYTPKDEEDEYDYSKEMEDEDIWDIINAYKLAGYVQHVQDLYSKDYIPESQFRVILWYS